MKIDDEIWSAYNGIKQSIQAASEKGDVNTCLEQVSVLWMFMNRFRNCDLQKYFDEDVQHWVAALNPPRRVTPATLHPKNTFRLAFIVVGLGDMGGASIPHRFMLKNFEWNGVKVENYFLISNFFRRPLDETDSLSYLRDHIQPQAIHYVPSELSHEARGQEIQRWLEENDIDFVLADTCPSTLFALAGRPAKIQATMSQDCYTFALGPGSGDITYLVTQDQVFKYRFEKAGADHFVKVIMLPLHSQDHVDAAEPISRSSMGIPEDAVISASSNMWKTFFGDGEILLEGIAELIRRFPQYHHVFIGTPRCRDNLDYFLSRNPDIRPNIHFAGPIKNIYRMLKSLDFWVNSFPTTGGSDIEMAQVGKPTISIAVNRNLDLHPAEFLCSNECSVVSLDEFIRLGTRMINEPSYRISLGQHLKANISREFDKNRLVSERLYQTMVLEYQRRQSGKPRMPSLGLEKTLDYEKRISLYNSFGRVHWTKEKRNAWLRTCILLYPHKSFAWIKLMEEALESTDRHSFDEIAAEAIINIPTDHRLYTMLAMGRAAFGAPEDGIDYACRAVSLATYDPIPRRVAARLLIQAGRLEEAAQVWGTIAASATAKNIVALLATEAMDSLPLYYNY